MTDASIERARTKFFATLPKRIACPKCQKSRAKEHYGVRLMNKNEIEKGKAPKFLRQSYCNTCRHE